MVAAVGKRNATVPLRMTCGPDALIKRPIDRILSRGDFVKQAGRDSLGGARHMSEVTFQCERATKKILNDQDLSYASTVQNTHHLSACWAVAGWEKGHCNS